MDNRFICAYLTPLGNLRMIRFKDEFDLTNFIKAKLQHCHYIIVKQSVFEDYKTIASATNYDACLHFGL